MKKDIDLINEKQKVRINLFNESVKQKEIDWDNREYDEYDFFNETYEAYFEEFDICMKSNFDVIDLTEKDTSYENTQLNLEKTIYSNCYLIEETKENIDLLNFLNLNFYIHESEDESKNYLAVFTSIKTIKSTSYELINNETVVKHYFEVM